MIDNKQHQQKNNLPLNTPLLIPRRDLQLLLRLPYTLHRPLHIKIDPIQQAPLIDHHGIQLLEDVREVDDALGDFFDFAFPVQDRGVVDAAPLAQRGGLREGVLRGGAVGEGVGVPAREGHAGELTP